MFLKSEISNLQDRAGGSRVRGTASLFKEPLRVPQGF